MARAFPIETVLRRHLERLSDPASLSPPPPDAPTASTATPTPPVPDVAPAYVIDGVPPEVAQTQEAPPGVAPIAPPASALADDHISRPLPLDPAGRLSEIATREEVLSRRCERARQLLGCYRQQYAALIREVQRKAVEFRREFGSPFEEEGDEEVDVVVVDDDDDDDADAAVADADVDGEEEEEDETNKMKMAMEEEEEEEEEEEKEKEDVQGSCIFQGCKSKAMPLTAYCHEHILSDSRGRADICGKPTNRAIKPTICRMHYLEYQAESELKEAGGETGESPNSDISTAESSCQIQEKEETDVDAHEAVEDGKVD